MSEISDESVERIRLEAEQNEWTIGEILGKGGWGTVVTAVDRFNGNFALKAINKNEIKDDNKDCSWQMQRIQDERDLLIELKSSRCCSEILFCKQEENHFYFGLKLYWMDLRQMQKTIMPDGIFTEDEAKFLMTELVSAVSYLHTRGIISRDIKRENIMITYDGHLKVCDYGLAMRIGMRRSLTEVTGTESNVSIYQTTFKTSLNFLFKPHSISYSKPHSIFLL